MVGRIYANCKEAISEIQRDLYEMGVEVHTQTMQNKDISNDPNYSTKEMQNYSFCILNSEDKDDIVKPNELEWCHAEFAERIAGWDKPKCSEQVVLMNANRDEIVLQTNDVPNHDYPNPGEAYKLREVWNEFLNDGSEGKFGYTYNERMAWQIDAVLEELKLHPETRQAIIEIHNRRIDQTNMGKIRVPCSMYYHLMIRDGKLDIIYNMRSTDFFTHFKNDIWLACELRNWFAKQLNIKPGKYFMNASSLHAYRKDFPEGVF